MLPCLGNTWDMQRAGDLHLPWWSSQWLLTTLATKVAIQGEITTFLLGCLHVVTGKRKTCRHSPLASPGSVPALPCIPSCGAFSLVAFSASYISDVTWLSLFARTVPIHNSPYTCLWLEKRRNPSLQFGRWCFTRRYLVIKQCRDCSCWVCDFYLS